MKHYVLGLVFNRARDKILLIEKKRPEWMAGRWNGIGGGIEENENPLQAMMRETMEEIGFSYSWIHVITFVCPGGTVFVFKAISIYGDIHFQQKEDEELKICDMYNLPTTMMANLRWIIPLSLSTIQFPVVIQQNELGVH